MFTDDLVVHVWLITLLTEDSGIISKHIIAVCLCVHTDTYGLAAEGQGRDRRVDSASVFKTCLQMFPR